MTRDITGYTKMICLLGSPIEHSLSPQMHNEAFSCLGLDYCYLAFDTRPEQLPDIMKCFPGLGVRGMNLTMPLKTAVIPFCDRLSPASEISGAVNTVVFEEDGSISGHTTDGSGFLLSLDAAGIPWRNRRLVLFGTGGAATSILIQAALDGASAVSVFTRPESAGRGKTEAIISVLNERTDCVTTLYEYEDSHIRRALSEASVLINASSVGMAPHTEECLVKEAVWLEEGLSVTDIIYEPRRTRLLQMAEQRGLRTLNGMYMLLYQGAASFQLWTGREMPTEHIRKKFFAENPRQMPVQP